MSQVYENAYNRTMKIAGLGQMIGNAGRRLRRAVGKTEPYDDFFLNKKVRKKFKSPDVAASRAKALAQKDHDFTRDELMQINKYNDILDTKNFGQAPNRKAHEYAQQMWDQGARKEVMQQLDHKGQSVMDQDSYYRQFNTDA